jgi:hypothetical protein
MARGSAASAIQRTVCSSNVNVTLVIAILKRCYCHTG